MKNVGWWSMFEPYEISSLWSLALPKGIPDFFYKPTFQNSEE
jgi:hypothetical protein